MSCGCHGEPMARNGRWVTCRVKRRASQARYERTAKAKRRQVVYGAEKGRQTRAAYVQRRYYSLETTDRLWVIERQLRVRRHGAKQRIRERQQRTED